MDNWPGAEQLQDTTKLKSRVYFLGYTYTGASSHLRDVMQNLIRDMVSDKLNWYSGDPL